VKEKHLQITGAARRAGNAGTPVPARKGRKLAAGKQPLLDAYLLNALGELSHSGELVLNPVVLSKATAPVALAKVKSDGSLVFRAMEVEKQASFGFADLTLHDRAQLSVLAATLRPDDREAQAMAGIYQEIIGKTASADEYYGKAGSEFGEVITGLFE
jgi:hypothetical protein